MTARSRRRSSTVATINDVARHAGVSSMTVSRVLNSVASVKESTRASVLLSIAELEYTPNGAARILAGASKTKIGLMYGNPSSGFLSELVIGCLDQTLKNDFQLVLEKCDLDAFDGKIVNNLVDGGVNGVVLPPPLCEDPSILERFAAAGVVVAAVAAGRPDAGTIAVGIDDRLAAHTMTKHLIALGHRRIGFILGDPKLSASGERSDGHRQALIDAGMPTDETLVVRGSFTYRSGLRAADELLALSPPPTAIFASNDDMAAAAVAVAHQRGLDVPADLTVCGFDDSPIATTIWPELTTVRQPIADMAREAVRLLARALSRPSATAPADRQTTLPFELVRRHSDAAPRRRDHPCS